MEDLNSVKSAAAEFKAQEDRLDVLWHNAGSFPPAGSKTKQGYELQLGVHCIAPHLFTELLTPIMERTAAERKPGTVRVAWVSSAGAEYLSPSGGGVGIDNLDYHKPASNLTQYGISKAGMILLSQEYAKRHRSAGIVHVVGPPLLISQPMLYTTCSYEAYRH
jgi:NAD(P)-dependent dehydrogenase (short-subunit alcohol dehydrogenase family)